MTAIAGHRGGAELWPENSLLGFRRAAKLPLDFVEFDVHVSADGDLFVHHDATLDRMTDRQGAIMDLTAAEISEATIRGADGEDVPRFGEVVEIFRPTEIALRVEIKPNAHAAPYPRISEKVAAALGDAGMLARTVVSAFEIDALARFREIAMPGHGFIWLVNPVTFRQIGGVRGAIPIAAEFGIAEIAPRQEVVTAEVVAAAKAAGLRLGAYAVNDRQTIRRMLDLDVVAFTTDRPDIALAERDRLAQAAARS